MGYSFQLTARVLVYAPSNRQDNTYHGRCYTSRGALAGTTNSSMDPPPEGSIRRPIAPWANALTTELHLAPGILYGWLKSLRCIYYVIIHDGFFKNQTQKLHSTTVASHFEKYCDKISYDIFCLDPVERPLIVRWVVGSFSISLDPLSNFSYNKGLDMYYPVTGMVHIGAVHLNRI